MCFGGAKVGLADSDKPRYYGCEGKKKRGPSIERRNQDAGTRRKGRYSNWNTAPPETADRLLLCRTVDTEMTRECQLSSYTRRYRRMLMSSARASSQSSTEGIRHSAVANRSLGSWHAPQLSALMPRLRTVSATDIEQRTPNPDIFSHTRPGP